MRFKKIESKVKSTAKPYKPVGAMMKVMGATLDSDDTKGSYIDVWDSGKNFKPKKNNQ
jgi:hypothetical protein